MRRLHVCKMTPEEEWRESTSLEFSDEARSRVKCPYCPYIIDNEMWKRHFDNHHRSNRPWLALPEPETFSVVPQFRAAPDPKQIICPYCQKVVSKYWGARHVKAEHPQENIPRLPSTCTSHKRHRSPTRESDSILDRERVRCAICTGSIVQSRLRRHMRESHLVPEDELPDRVPKKSAMCPITQHLY